MSLIPSGELKAACGIYGHRATRIVSMSLIPSGELKDNSFPSFFPHGFCINESNSLRGVESSFCGAHLGQIISVSMSLIPSGELKGKVLKYTPMVANKYQ